MSIALLFHYLMLNMFQILIHPSSGACDLFVELFHGLYCCGSICVGVTLCFGCGGVVSVCGLRHYWSVYNKASDIRFVSLYSSTNSCFIISLLYSSKCFEHCCAHHQEFSLNLRTGRPTISVTIPDSV